MTIERLGEAAFIVRDLDVQPYLISTAAEKLDHQEVAQVVAAYNSLGVYTRPGTLWTEEDALRFVQELSPIEEGQQPLHRVPVLYDGEDLDQTAESLGLTSSEVIRIHTSVEFRCFAIGFSPGFPYLGWLPDELCGVARRPSPRARVASGSVAITGKQTGIYPSELPGGWALLGRTPFTIADWEDDYFPISAGDRIQFYSIDQATFREMSGRRL